jgi:hypothetical protein
MVDADGNSIKIGDKVSRHPDWIMKAVMPPDRSKVTGFSGPAVVTVTGVYLARTLRIMNNEPERVKPPAIMPWDDEPEKNWSAYSFD